MTICGDRFGPSLVLAHVVCDRAVWTKNGKHTGKHIWHDPETGRPRVTWWRNPPQDPDRRLRRDAA